MTETTGTENDEAQAISVSEEPVGQYMVRGVSMLTRARLRALAELHQRPIAGLLDDVAELCEAMLPAKEAASYEIGLRARLALPRGGMVPIGSLPALAPEQRQQLGLYQPIPETRLGKASQLARLFRPTLVLDLVVLGGDFWIVVPHPTFGGGEVFSADDAQAIRQVVTRSGASALDAALFVRLHQPGGGALAADHLRALDVWQQWAERIVGRPVGVDRRLPADVDGALVAGIETAARQYRPGECHGVLSKAFAEAFWKGDQPVWAAPAESGGAA